MMLVLIPYYLVVHYFALPKEAMPAAAGVDLAKEQAEVDALRARVAAGAAAAGGEELDEEAERRRVARLRG